MRTRLSRGWNVLLNLAIFAFAAGYLVSEFQKDWWRPFVLVAVAFVLFWLITKWVDWTVRRKIPHSRDARDDDLN